MTQKKAQPKLSFNLLLIFIWPLNKQKNKRNYGRTESNRIALNTINLPHHSLIRIHTRWKVFCQKYKHFCKRNNKYTKAQSGLVCKAYYLKRENDLRQKVIYQAAFIKVIWWINDTTCLWHKLLVNFPLKTGKALSKQA